MTNLTIVVFFFTCFWCKKSLFANNMRKYGLNLEKSLKMQENTKDVLFW